MEKRIILMGLRELRVQLLLLRIEFFLRFLLLHQMEEVKMVVMLCAWDQTLNGTHPLGFDLLVVREFELGQDVPFIGFDGRLIHLRIFPFAAVLVERQRSWRLSTSGMKRITKSIRRLSEPSKSTTKPTSILILLLLSKSTAKQSAAKSSPRRIIWLLLLSSKQRRIVLLILSSKHIVVIRKCIFFKKY